MPGHRPPAHVRVLGALGRRCLAVLCSPLGLAAGLVFGLDRLSKFWVVEMLDLGHLLRIEVLPPYLVFIMAWNTGINFGFLTGFGIDPDMMRPVLVAVALAVSAVLAWWARRRAGTPGGRALAWGAGLVIGGALSNAWDRLQYGAVADFLNMSCCGIANPYAFNIADAAIFAGAVLIAARA